VSRSVTWDLSARSRTAVRGGRCRFAKLSCHAMPCDDVNMLFIRHKSLSVNILRCLAQRSSRRDNASYHRYDVSYRRLHASSLLRHASNTLDNASYHRCEASYRRYETSSPQRGRSALRGNTSYRRYDASYRRCDVSPCLDHALIQGDEACYRRYDASYRQDEPSYTPFPTSMAECRDLDSDSLDWPRESENGQYTHAVKLNVVQSNGEVR